MAAKSTTKPGRLGFMLTVPSLLLVLALVILPLGYAVVISMTDFPLVGSYHYVGLANYRTIFHDSQFLHAILLTVVYTAIVTGPIFVVGYGLAMLTRSNRRGSTLLRTMFFLPYIVGLTFESFILYVELQPDSGGVNFLLRILGLTDGSTAWLVHTVPGMVAICVLVVWFSSGLTMVLLLGGMQGVPRELYESAALDGAGRWRTELRITLPLLRQPIALSLILSVIGSFLAFNQFEILTQGGPGTSTTPVVLWIYQVAFTQGLIGKATAGALLLVVAVAAISAGQFILLRDPEANAR
ncbi:sugar ABC transporter permease [Actinospica sp. MGRD01-02]|uniref:Sugar ABC transporter permease n=1 Tax=Actinospica acidithermotolerans TaxID=2828514 RepID=A0A941E7Z1_9ACTN|nr:sugar ABC transporter permease [Actinospica acidithermotolerans]MBR7825130.1 sugar ABC transporter permease [Actinospica acidithermotolerans]